MSGEKQARYWRANLRILTILLLIWIYARYMDRVDRDYRLE